MAVNIDSRVAPELVKKLLVRNVAEPNELAPIPRTVQTRLKSVPVRGTPHDDRASTCELDGVKSEFDIVLRYEACNQQCVFPWLYPERANGIWISRVNYRRAIWNERGSPIEGVFPDSSNSLRVGYELISPASRQSRPFEEEALPEPVPFAAAPLDAVNVENRWHSREP
jgi:hypothetical protein